MHQISTGTKPTAPNGWLYHNLATVKSPKGVDLEVSYSVWQMIVDEHTGLKFSAVYSSKNGILVDTSRKLLGLENTAECPILHFRQDNAGKNKKLQALIQGPEWQFKCKFEYTAKATP